MSRFEMHEVSVQQLYEQLGYDERLFLEDLMERYNDKLGYFADFWCMIEQFQSNWELYVEAELVEA